MVSCPAATALSFDSTLKSREALTNAASCFSAIENLRNSCAYSLPDVAFYTVNGKVEGVHVFDRGLIEAATSCTSGTFLCGNGSVTRTRSQCGYSGIDAICVGGRWVGY